MLTMAGNRMPMLVNPPGLHQVNMQPPRLTPEEDRRRKEMLASVRSFDKKSLAQCETEDKSVPIVSGRMSTPAGWKDVPGGGAQPMVQLNPVGGPGRGGQGGRGRAGPGGRGRGLAGAPPGGLGDLFAGGFKPNPGALRGGRGSGKMGVA